MEKVFSLSEIEECKQKVLKILSDKYWNCQIEDIKDAVSDAVEKYIVAIHSADRVERFDSLKKICSWLYKVAKNNLIDELRRKYKIIPLESENIYNDDDQPFKTYGEFFEEDIPFIEFIKNLQDEYNINNILKNFWELIYKEGNWDKIEKIILQKHHQEGIDLRVLAEEIKMTPNSLYLKNKRLKEKIKDIMKKNNIHNLTDLDY